MRRSKKTHPLLAILLLLPLSVSAGELDGKAISCDDGRKNIEFRGGRVVNWCVFGGGGILGDARITKCDDEAPSYYALTNTVFWSAYIGTGELGSHEGKPSLAFSIGYILDRKTLSLKIESERSDGETKERTYQCEVYLSIKDFKEMLEARRAEMQRRIDEDMEENKI